MNRQIIPKLIVLAIVIALGVGLAIVQPWQLRRSGPVWGAFQAGVSKSSLKSLDELDWSPVADGFSQFKVVMMTTQGVIKLKLRPAEAPKTVRRFLELVLGDFYDQTFFFSYQEDFAICGGSRSLDGESGSGTPLGFEKTPFLHRAGVIGMVRRRNHTDSADSQFYILLKDQPSLDGEFTAFGKLVEGQEALEKLRKGDRIDYSYIE